MLFVCYIFNNEPKYSHIFLALMVDKKINESLKLQWRIKQNIIWRHTNSFQYLNIIFDAIKEIDESAVIISLNQLRITHGKDMPTKGQYNTVFKDWRKYNVTKREYVSFKLKSTQKISQLKYGS